MEWECTFEKTIRQRRSVRTYTDQQIEPEKLQKLKDFLEERNRETKHMRFIFLELDAGNGKIGLYGMISGAKKCIAAVVDKKITGIENLGLEFEKIILFATSLGLGTCWLAGFDRKTVENKLALQNGEFVAVISPVGYARAPRIKEGLTRLVVGADKRKPWDELFFDGSPKTPLAKERAGKFALPLEMVRLAPSASNRQPWRVVYDEKGFHFCLVRNRGYGQLLLFDIQKSDIGIAMCHFELTVREQHLPGKWIELEDMRAGGELGYVGTWSIHAE